MHPEWGYRRKLVQWLNDTYGNRFVQYGGDKPTIRGAELNQLYSSCKIVIGDSLCKDFMDSYYYSDRCFEVTGRGGFMIAPYIAGITDHFVDRKEAVFYSFDNFTQLKNMIDYYLEHDDERETIRLAGHNRTKKYNTYTDRMKTMLDVIKSSGDGLITSSLDSTTPIKINFGSGNDPQYGHINVDMLKRDDVELVHNLMDFPYPFEDNSASHIRAVDVLEHLDHYTDGRRPTIVAFFEECYRILKTGGELYIQVPSWNTEIFEIDVTHVRGFHEKSFDFLDKTTWYGEIRDFYTNANFKITKRDKFDNGVMRFWLVKR
jgi:predicted SAM-dependent methyltransferase